MNKRFFILLGVLFLMFVTVIGIAAQTPTCYGISFGVEVRPEAEAILDAQGYLVANIQNEMEQTLTRQQQLTGECFAGEMGLIVNTEPRVFAVFEAQFADYGVLRIMTEAQYYPAPFPTNSVGWIHSQELREP